VLVNVGVRIARSAAATPIAAIVTATTTPPRARIARAYERSAAAFSSGPGDVAVMTLGARPSQGVGPPG